MTNKMDFHLSVSQPGLSSCRRYRCPEIQFHEFYPAIVTTEEAFVMIDDPQLRFESW